MKILGIETSCDETALCLMNSEGGLDAPKFEVLETALISQIDIHKEYGGVFPALAKREHAKNIVPLMANLFANQNSIAWENPQINWEKVQEILNREHELFENLKKHVEENFVTKNLRPDFEMIAVTSGPGLEPALWVGINFARAISEIFQIPVLPVNHMEGHIVSVLLEKDQPNFPAVALLISGGHTEIIEIESWGQYKKIGETLDDAVGEAYDKVARMIGLEYPGGPQISRLALTARDQNLSDEQITFPRPLLHSADLNFSLSGLKTAVLYKIKELQENYGEITDLQKQIIAKEFEQAVVDVINMKTKKALEQTGANSLIVGGGVIANKYIRENLSKIAEEKNIPVHFPTTELSTDNAVMISIAGYIKSFRQTPQICPEIKAEGNLIL